MRKHYWNEVFVPEGSGGTTSKCLMGIYKEDRGFLFQRGHMEKTSEKAYKLLGEIST